MPLYIVDSIIQVRNRYIIEADELEHAYDEVTMRTSNHPADYFQALSEIELGETILDGREISKDEFEKLLVDSVTKKEFRREINRANLHEGIIRKIDYAR